MIAFVCFCPSYFTDSMLSWYVIVFMVLMGVDRWVADAVQKNNVAVRRLLRLPHLLSLTSTRPNIYDVLPLVSFRNLVSYGVPRHSMDKLSLAPAGKGEKLQQRERFWFHRMCHHILNLPAQLGWLLHIPISPQEYEIP